MTSPPEVEAAIARFAPRCVDDQAARFAREVVALAAPAGRGRAKALLFACSRLSDFGSRCGLDQGPEVLLHPSVIERFLLRGTTGLSPATRRTLRANLRYVARAVLATGTGPTPIPRDHAKAPYSRPEIASYLALTDAQPTLSRRFRSSALICLGAGAGLTGTDLRDVKGTDLEKRSGGLVIAVGGRRPRVVPVRREFHERLLAAAAYAKHRYLIGGVDPHRRNVTSALVKSLAGGDDLPALEVARLRATWLVACAEEIGLKGFLQAAGITCSQRLGDLLRGLDPPDEATLVALLEGRL